ncbi:MAG: exonuclease subunit SbcD [Candidatus Kapabacteria bacterium]|nr:exonuclease subunit SbcD [Candidatus Kapabacteria bacterium]
MKFLHTADWHLGRRLHGQDLAAEHDAALDAILNLIREHRIDALVHAGDVFDTGTPPQSALKQYYSFLTRAVQAGCGTIIITGGNHDSPAALNAPRDLLEAMNIHVVGGATENIADEVIAVKNTSGTTIGYCCAVPFLRDKDLRYSLPGESDSERSQRLIAGIRGHYEKVVAAAQTMNTEGLPIIATGHLFAQGGITGDLDNKEQIHVGNLGQIGADAFPEALVYVALGHLHRPQTVGKQERVRYSGSPVALDFSERDDTKQVVVVECLPAQPASIEIVPLPTFRRLVRFSGTWKEVEATLKSFDASKYTLPTFVELRIVPTSEGLFSGMNVDEHFRSLATKLYGSQMLIVRVVQERKRTVPVFAGNDDTRLEELTREFVFEELLKREGKEAAQILELKQTYRELLSLLNERGETA